MASLARRLYFQLAIRKSWIPLWVRWGGQTGQFTGGHGLVHCLVGTSPLLIMPTVTATHAHALAYTTLLLLQCRTQTQSWPGLSASHLMRWRYFILTLLNKYKKNHFIIYGQKTCSYINIITTLKKCTSQCIFLDKKRYTKVHFFPSPSHLSGNSEFRLKLAHLKPNDNENLRCYNKRTHSSA